VRELNKVDSVTYDPVHNSITRVQEEWKKLEAAQAGDPVKLREAIGWFIESWTEHAERVDQVWLRVTKKGGIAAAC
jgi:hypothetical protein